MLVGSFFFVFKQKPAYEMRISDWSSDVCSSDLLAIQAFDHDATGDAKPAPELHGGIDHPLGRLGGVHLGHRGLAGDAVGAAILGPGGAVETGRASCRDRVCQYV